MLSGRLPFEHGVRHDAGFALNDDARTLAELLRGRGFATGAAVSSFLLRRESGLAQGFGFFDAELPDEPGESGSAVHRDGTLTVDAAERWLRTQGGQRFFLFIEADDASADVVVTRIVETLKQRRLYDGATILFTAARGESAAATRGESAAAALDEQALRVPLIVKMPGGEGAGRRVQSAVQLIDIVPTVVDFVRAPMPSGLRGRSLRPVLDSDDAVLADQPIYAESMGAHFRVGAHPLYSLTRGGVRYVRNGGERLLEIPQPNPAVMTDGSTEMERLRVELDRLLDGRPIAMPSEIADEDEDRFAMLGYLPGAPIAARDQAEIADSRLPDVVRAHRAAVLLAGEKKYAAAADRLRAIARDYPGLAVVQYQLGKLSVHTGRLQDAIAAYRAAGKVQPDTPDIFIALSGALARAGKCEAALKEASLGVALAERVEPARLPAAHQAASLAAAAIGDTDAAAQHAAAAQTPH
jgi:TolA-binding protein